MPPSSGSEIVPLRASIGGAKVWRHASSGGSVVPRRSCCARHMECPTLTARSRRNGSTGRWCTLDTASNEARRSRSPPAAAPDRRRGSAPPDCRRSYWQSTRPERVVADEAADRRLGLSTPVRAAFEPAERPSRLRAARRSWRAGRRRQARPDRLAFNGKAAPGTRDSSPHRSEPSAIERELRGGWQRRSPDGNDGEAASDDAADDSPAGWGGLGARVPRWRVRPGSVSTSCSWRSGPAHGRAPF